MPQQELRQKTKLEAETCSRLLFFLQDSLPSASTEQLSNCRRALIEAQACIRCATEALTAPTTKRPNTAPGMKPSPEPDADRLRELLEGNGGSGDRSDLEVNIA